MEDRVRMRCVELFARELWTVGLYHLATAAAIEKAAPTAALLQTLHSKLKVVIDTRGMNTRLRGIKRLEQIDELYRDAERWWAPGPLPDREPAGPFVIPSIKIARAVPVALAVSLLNGAARRQRPRGDRVAWRRLIVLLRRSHNGKDLDAVADGLGIDYEERGNRRNRVVDLVKQAREGGAPVELRGDRGTVRTVHLMLDNGQDLPAGAGA